MYNKHREHNPLSMASHGQKGVVIRWAYDSLPKAGEKILDADPEHPMI